MRKKVIISFSAGVILVMIVTIGAIIGGKSGNDNSVPVSTPNPIVQVTEAPVPTEAPQVVVEVTPAPEATEAPIVEVFIWEDIENTDGLTYHPSVDISFFTEPRQDAEAIKVLSTDTQFGYNAEAYINGEKSSFVRVELDGVQGYVLFPQLLCVEEELAEQEPVEVYEGSRKPTQEEIDAFNDALNKAAYGEDYKEKENSGGYDPYANLMTTYPGDATTKEENQAAVDEAKRLMDELGITFQ